MYMHEEWRWCDTKNYKCVENWKKVIQKRLCECEFVWKSVWKYDHHHRIYTLLKKEIYMLSSYIMGKKQLELWQTSEAAVLLSGFRLWPQPQSSQPPPRQQCVNKNFAQLLCPQSQRVKRASAVVGGKIWWLRATVAMAASAYLVTFFILWFFFCLFLYNNPTNKHNYYS